MKKQLYFFFCEINQSWGVQGAMSDFSFSFFFFFDLS